MQETRQHQRVRSRYNIFYLGNPRHTYLLEQNLVLLKQLVKQFKFSNYEDSVNFCKKVADLAESEDHHPKIILEYGSVEVFWWSHKIKGLHKNDFICAAKTDLI